MEDLVNNWLQMQTITTTLTSNRMVTSPTTQMITLQEMKANQISQVRSPTLNLTMCNNS